MFAHAFSKVLLAAACLTASSLFLYRPAIVLHKSDDDFGLSLQSAPEAGRGGQLEAAIWEGDAVPTSLHWANGSEFFPASRHATLPTARPVALPQIQPQFESTRKEEGEEEALEVNDESLIMRDRIRSTFMRSWKGYKDRAWGKDELRLISGEGDDTMNGWTVTLIETLDTLWLLDQKTDFEEALAVVAKIDFTTSHRRDIAVHEATTRCLGGLLGAYEISDHSYPILLEKAIQLGDVLLGAFDTPNRMPINFYNWTPSSTSKPHRASSGSSLAELGSLSLEFTRLAQLTGDSKYYDVVNRILEALSTLQSKTQVPGLWPSTIDASGCKRSVRTGNSCTSNGLTASPLADEEVYTMAEDAGSVYNTLLKQSLLIGNTDKRLQNLLSKSISAITSKLLFRPLIGGSPDVLMLGERILDRNASWWHSDKTVFEPRVSRSSCSVAAMLALASRTLSQPDDLEIARKLTEGCIWAHDTSRSGLMPADFTVMACAEQKNCKWELDEFHDWWKALDLRLHEDFDLGEYEVSDTPGNATSAFNGTGVYDDGDDGSRPLLSRRHDPLQSQTVTRPTPFLGHEDYVRMRVWNEGLAEGMLDIHDRTYDLGSEPIEAIFTMWRITGEKRWREAGWKIFEAIETMSETEFGNAMVADVTKDEHEKVLEDRMPGYWMGATLKWFWLLFEEESVLGLDEWVVTKGGHVLRLPR